MEYARKLVYCQNKKDTQEFYEMLRINNIDNIEDFRIVAKSTAKQTWDAEWHLIDGVNLFGYEVPFTFTSPWEVEHPDAFYKDPELIELEEIIADKIKNSTNGFIEKEFVYDFDPMEKVIYSGELFIWLEGHRGRLKDGYTMLGIDDLAIKVLYDLYTMNKLPQDFLTDGKIDLDFSLDCVCNIVAKVLYGKKTANIIRNVQTIDIDGMEDPDYVLNEFFNHDYIK